jgi:uncharacterized membrane protein YdjX (TVP38/TMEM64 family)
MRTWRSADIAAGVRLARLAMLPTLSGVFAVAYLVSAGLRAEVGLVLDLLAQGDATAVRDYILSYGYWAPAISLALMVVQALAAPVPSFVITFANGLAFGVFWGWVLSVAGHALAASVCFWIARAVGRGPVEGLVGRTGLAAVDRWFTQRGIYAIFMARLLPGVGFDAVSYAAGLSGLRVGRFIGATTLGIIPQTLLYAYLGQNATQYLWVLLAANGVVVAGVALVGLVARRMRRRAQHIPPVPGRRPRLPTAAR